MYCKIVLTTLLYCTHCGIDVLTGNHTFAAVRGHESYDLLSSAFSHVFEEVNSVIEDPYIEIDGETWKLEIVAGGDYKVCMYMHMYFQHTFTQFYVCALIVLADHNGDECCKFNVLLPVVLRFFQ